MLDRELLKKTGLLGIVSTELVVCIGGGYWVGTVLDGKFHLGSVCSVVLMLAGLAYATWRVFGLAKKWMK